ncbi:MAG: monofunctional biosynthetic peptidoglycan transglycosylase [Flavobacteriales bacterium]|nr:MAG: monofunctional biosynthetic peptidoglycan transglycosylase [Flavobacteriales bacterium]
MRRFILPPLRWLCAMAFWCVVVSVLWVLLLRVADPPVTGVMVEQAGAQESFERTWKDLDEMSLWMPLAVIASEDQKFMDHRGFDREALEEAWANYNNPKRRNSRLKGASTISQQTAKNVFLWDGRTLVRKGIEAWFTVLLEAFWSKERILEVYLNVAETGKGRFGTEAASQGCFGKAAAKLSQREAALIAVQLPSPRRYSCKRPGPFTTRRAAWVVRNINNLGNVLDPAVREKNAKAKEDKEARKARRKKKVAWMAPVGWIASSQSLLAMTMDAASQPHEPVAPQQALGVRHREALRSDPAQCIHFLIT